MANGMTIFALASGGGLAAVSVIRISGARARMVIEKVAGKCPEPRQVALRVLRDPTNGTVLDEAIVLWMPGPASFTGEDSAELHVHGSHAVVRIVLDVLARTDGCCMAQPGEFTRRAFENGKLDLMEVEGLADLIAAQSETQRRQAWFHKSGGASEVFAGWRQDLIRVLANLEAAIDFSDEEGVEAAAVAQADEALGEVHKSIARELGSGRRGEAVRNGVRVVLAGPPNAGKSSLLNRIAERDAAIVSEVPGTTRDAIEVHLELAGIPVVLVDTAGLRDETADALEQMGMARSRAQVLDADIVVWVDAPDVQANGAGAGVDSDALRIVNKCDLPSSLSGPSVDLAVSARTGEGLDALVALLTARVEAAFVRAEPALVTRQRHVDALEACLSHLGQAAENRDKPLELTAESLRLAVRALERLIGKVDVEDLLDVIFRDFCIGK